jgi:hypothetical protein
MWFPHGLGVRREDESAVGAGRRRRSQAMWSGRESSVEVWRWQEAAYLVAVGRAPFQRARPYCLLDWQGAQAPIDYLIGRGLKPFWEVW